MVQRGDSRRLMPATFARSLRGRGDSHVLALAAAVALAGSPALAAKPLAKAAKPRLTLETSVTPFQSPVGDAATFSFTAPGNPAALARLQTVERAFRFTPSGQGDKAENRRGLTLGVASRVVVAGNDRSRATVAPEALTATPASYKVDLSLAWRGFAVTSGIAHSEGNPALALNGGRRDSLDVGLSYTGKNWKTTLLGTADRGSLLVYAPLERRYSLELGGAYLVAPRLAVTGGVRYRLAPEAPSLLDPARDDRAVYLGTNIAF